MQEKYPHRLVQIDVDKEGIAEFVDQIPVIKIGPYQIKAPFDQKTLEMTLGAAVDRLQQLEMIQEDTNGDNKKKEMGISAVDRFFFWLSKRYMLVFNGFVLIYVGLAFLAPALQANGNLTPAKLIYTVYSRLCHQLSYRSWFIYGEQAAYPREYAGVDGLVTYEEATGFDPFDTDTAITFLGNSQIGYKTALCQRDIAIYAGILLFGIIFSLTGKKLPGLPITIWFVLGILPIGLDGVSQLVSQLPWDIMPLRESTPLLRTITGGIFGFATAWFGYPIVEESMADTRKVMTVKFKTSEVVDSE